MRSHRRVRLALRVAFVAACVALPSVQARAVTTFDGFLGPGGDDPTVFLRWSSDFGPNQSQGFSDPPNLWIGGTLHANDSIPEPGAAGR